MDDNLSEPNKIREGRGSATFKAKVREQMTWYNIEFVLRCFPQRAQLVTVNWSRDVTFSMELRQFIAAILEGDLYYYLRHHPVGALEVTIVSGRTVVSINNDLYPSAFFGLLGAIADAKLPPLIPCSAPDE